MCGIVGRIGTSTGISTSTIADAAALLFNRGPDDAGAWCEENVALAHRRLSILDISHAGHQPMISRNGRYVIVFNGEIYNFQALKSQLEPDQSQWNSHGDTEVILAAYERWGTKCVEYFRGMFAFAIWDRSKKVLFAARDRMGVKPFYYHHSSLCFVFSSRPRAIYPLIKDHPSEIDSQALRYYLEIGYIPAPYSIHKSIRKLPPGHYLVLENNEAVVQRYWDCRIIEPDPGWTTRPEEDLLDELDEIVSGSVSLRMVSDVPLGAFLSGGIDSSLIVAMMARHSDKAIKTFTIGFAEPEYDESNHADAVARSLSTDHFCERLHVDDLLELIPTFVAEYDEPFFDSSAFPAMAVSRMASGHVKVSLSGDGGDELFGGYNYYRIMNQMAPAFGLSPGMRGALAAIFGFIPARRTKLLAQALSEPDPASAFGFSRSIAKDSHNILSTQVMTTTSSIREHFSGLASTFPKTLRPCEQAMRLDTLLTLPDDYLQKIDVASMAFSLESRDPLLDHKLVEWGMKLPLHWKLRGNDNKYLLRQLAYRYVPRGILDRPKRGFGVPVDTWLKGSLRKWAEERFGEPTSYSSLPLDRAQVISLWESYLKGQRGVHSLLWAVLMLMEFSRAHLR